MRHKQIVNGVLYDTETSQHLFKIETGSQYSSRWTDVYKSQNGTFFEVKGWWGCAKDFQPIEVISMSQVEAMVGTLGDIELYQKVTGKTVKTA